MSFKPQTKRFALVPVEPGNEKDTDILIHQGDCFDLALSFSDESTMLLAGHGDAAIIAALGFPTEGEEA